MKVLRSPSLKMLVHLNVIGVDLSKAASSAPGRPGLRSPFWASLYVCFSSARKIRMASLGSLLSYARPMILPESRTSSCSRGWCGHRLIIRDETSNQILAFLVSRRKNRLWATALCEEQKELSRENRDAIIMNMLTFGKKYKSFQIYQYRLL